MSAPQIVADLGELEGVVKHCLRDGQPIACEGNGSKRHLGPAWSQDVRLLSVARIDDVRTHEPGDLVVTAQAGARLSRLQAVLAERGQWLPVDPPHADTTIGGMLATASAGPRRLGYGPIKDQLLGMRVLGPRGVITRSGGQVVKNVTGFDLHKLHTGAFGSLGIIVEATFKVRARPAVRAVFVAGYADRAAAARALVGLWHSPLSPVALEVLDGVAATQLGGHVPDLPVAPVLALVGVEGSQPVFERHAAEVPAALTRAGAITPALVLRDDHAERLWAGLRDGAAPLGAHVIVRLGARPAALADALASLTATAAVAASVGDGLVRAVLPEQDAAQARAWVEARHREWHAHGGYAVVEAAPLTLPGRATLPFLPPSRDAADETWARLQTQLRQSWDERNLFNPGRVPW